MPSITKTVVTATNYSCSTIASGSVVVLAGGGGGGSTSSAVANHGGSGGANGYALSGDHGSYVISGVQGVSNVLKVNGAGADVVIDDVSVVKTMERLTLSIGAIETQLAILRPNTELEKDWERLREIREEYHRLEKEIKEKIRVWDSLK